MAKKKVLKKASKKKKLRVKKATPLLKEQAKKEGIRMSMKAEELKKAEFSEYHGAAVICPECQHGNSLELRMWRYRKKDIITCEKCGKKFKLGKSV